MFGLGASNVGTWQMRGLVRAETQMASLSIFFMMMMMTMMMMVMIMNMIMTKMFAES